MGDRAESDLCACKRRSGRGRGVRPL